MADELRELGREDLEQFWQLDALSFASDDEHHEPFLRHASKLHAHGIFVDGVLVAASAVIPFGQYFGGRRVPMGGLSSVSVAPEHRGGGFASRVVRASIAGMEERGDSISALYPGTTELYRRLGWEVAGSHSMRTLPLRALLALPREPGARVRRAEFSDLSLIQSIYSGIAPSINGHLARGRRWPDAQAWNRKHVYIAEDESGQPIGYLIYRDVPAVTTGYDFGIRLEECFALTSPAKMSLLRLLGTHGTQADRVVYVTGPRDGLALLLPEQESRPLIDVQWMLRINDVRSAIAARGFPPGFACAVPLTIGGQDGAEATSFVLEVEAGRGILEPGRSGEGPRIEVGAFASLYSGWATCGELERAGRLFSGDAAQRALLDSAFAGAPAYMVEEF